MEYKIYEMDKELVNTLNQFHRMFYQKGTHSNVYYKGTHCLKNPLDLWIYQEIMWEIKPDFVIETGTAFGGTALYLADLMDVMNIAGHVFTIDNWSENITITKLPTHSKIMYCEGDSVGTDTLYFVNQYAKKAKTVMVILDSDHHKDHVLQELMLYSKYVTKNSYIIVEDTNINGHPVCPDYGEGPMEAVEQFLLLSNAFVLNREKEKFMLTYNRKGYLRKVF